MPTDTMPTDTTTIRIYHWASMLDQDDPSLSDLALGADELVIPIEACREVLSQVGNGEMGELVPSLAVALTALMDQLETWRDRLAKHLYRLSRLPVPEPLPVPERRGPGRKRFKR